MTPSSIQTDIQESDTHILEDFAAALTNTMRPELPEIRTNGRQLRDISSDAISALQTAGGIYVRGGEVCRIRCDEKGHASIEALNDGALRGMLERSANFFRLERQKTESGEWTSFKVIVPPGKELVTDILTLADRPFPPIEGIIESPIMRPDGTIVTEPGYDPATRLFYNPIEGFKLPNLPENPTREDAEAALVILRDLYCDFPFVDDASRDNVLAPLLTIIGRPMISEPVPMPTMDATTQSTGKTLVAEVTVQAATGSPPVLCPAPSDPEEWRKTITSKLSTGASAIIFDNVTKTLEDGSLALVLTAQQWSDRLMGRNDKNISLTVRAVIIATGNNLRVGGDLVSRCYPIAMDAKMARPQERDVDKFRYPNIKTYVEKNRGLLVGAALTILRAWVVAGKPPPTCPRMRYAAWRNVIGGALEYAGATAFLGNLAEFQRSSDDEGPAWEAFISKLREIFGESSATAGQIFLRFVDNTELCNYLPPEVQEFISEHGKPKFVQRLSAAFKSRKGKRHGDTAARVEADRTSNRTAMWKFYVNE